MVLKIATRDSIDLDANHYAKHSSLQNNLAKTVLDSYFIDPNALILDVGCGDGSITAELANRANFGEVLGIDSSKKMVKFASEKFQKKFSNLRFMRVNAEQIQSPHQFDLIVSFSCFHWLKNPATVVHRLYTSLKKGREMLILTYPKESPYYSYLESALKKYPDFELLSANRHMLSISEYRKLFLENQLEILNFHKQSLFASYNSLQEVQDFIEGWLNCYVPLPDHLHQSFLCDVCDIITKDLKRYKSEKILIPYTALVIRVKKLNNE